MKHTNETAQGYGDEASPPASCTFSLSSIFLLRFSSRLTSHTSHQQSPNRIALSGSHPCFEKMYSNVLLKIQDSIANIDILIGQRVSRLKSGTVQCGSWKLDQTLKDHINNIKIHSESLSKTCTKLVLLVSAKPSQLTMESIIAELSDLCNVLVGTYL